jgi:hypothetical protein
MNLECDVVNRTINDWNLHIFKIVKQGGNMKWGKTIPIRQVNY